MKRRDLFQIEGIAAQLYFIDCQRNSEVVEWWCNVSKDIKAKYRVKAVALQKEVQ